MLIFHASLVLSINLHGLILSRSYNSCKGNFDYHYKKPNCKKDKDDDDKDDSDKDDDDKDDDDKDDSDSDSDDDSH